MSEPSLPPLFAVERGVPAGPVLLLLHPLGADHSFWDECAEVWSRDYRTIACDLRGAGRSVAPSRPWTAADQVRDLLVLLDSMKVKDVVLIGCAIGSLVAIKLAAELDARLKGLVLSDTAPGLGEVSRVRTQARVDLVLREGLGVLLPDVIDLAFNQQEKGERYSRYTEMFLRNSVEGYAAIALGMMGTDLSNELASIICPTLVTVGGHDTLLPPELSKSVHLMIAGSEFKPIPNAAHFPPYQTPVEFAYLVNDFLRRRVIKT